MGALRAPIFYFVRILLALRAGGGTASEDVFDQEHHVSKVDTAAAIDIHQR